MDFNRRLRFSDNFPIMSGFDASFDGRRVIKMKIVQGAKVKLGGNY